MARKRMFAKEVVCSTEFVILPHSAQCLYFHLGMECDDDGYVEYILLMRKIEGTKEDLRRLQESRFVTVYNMYTLCITHHNKNNSIPKDRYRESSYKETFPDCNIELDQQFNPLSTECKQNVNKLSTQTRLDKTRLEEKEPLSGKEKEPDDLAIVCERVMDYLNKKTKKKEGRGFRNNKNNHKFIKARLKEKYTAEDFKKVIDVKVSEWLDDPDMNKNLRPQTLFGNNFESYLVQAPPGKVVKQETEARDRFINNLPQYMILNESIASKIDIVDALKTNKDDTLKQLKEWRELPAAEQDKRLRNVK